MNLCVLRNYRENKQSQGGQLIKHLTRCIRGFLNCTILSVAIHFLPSRFPSISASTFFPESLFPRLDLHCPHRFWGLKIPYALCCSIWEALAYVLNITEKVFFCKKFYWGIKYTYLMCKLINVDIQIHIWEAKNTIQGIGCLPCMRSTGFDSPHYIWFPSTGKSDPWA